MSARKQDNQNKRPPTVWDELKHLDGKLLSGHVQWVDKDGRGEGVIKSKYGNFYFHYTACPAYPGCKYTYADDDVIRSTIQELTKGQKVKFKLYINSYSAQVDRLYFKTAVKATVEEVDYSHGLIVARKEDGDYINASWIGFRDIQEGQDYYFTPAGPCKGGNFDATHLLLRKAA